MILSDEILVAYADGELDPEMVRQVAKALETDSEARKKVRVFRETAALVRAAYEGQPRESIAARREIGWAKAKPLRRRFRLWRSLFPMLGIALGVCFALMFDYRGAVPPRDPSAPGSSSVGMIYGGHEEGRYATPAIVLASNLVLWIEAGYTRDPVAWSGPEFLATLAAELVGRRRGRT